jgi:hypothetical protein
LVLLAVVALCAPQAGASTPTGANDTGAHVTISLIDARLLPLFGIHGQTLAYGADLGRSFKKGPTEFFQELLDLVLKLLALIGFVATILAGITLWLDQRAAARPREDLRICPSCYALVQRRSAKRCPRCHGALLAKTDAPAPPSRTPSPPDRVMRGDAIVGRQTQRAVSMETMDETREKAGVLDEPIREELPRPEIRPRPHLREPPISEPTSEPADDDDEQDALEDEAWEREDRARRRKELIYAYVSAMILGYVAVALLLLFGRL